MYLRMQNLFESGLCSFSKLSVIIIRSMHRMNYMKFINSHRKELSITVSSLCIFVTETCHC